MATIWKQSLNKQEMLLGLEDGKRRLFQGLERSALHNLSGNPTYGWEHEIEAACLEIALAKKTGLKWTGHYGNPKLRDVEHLECRWITRASYGLAIKPRDCMDAPYVLGRGRLGEYEFLGWYFGREARKDVWLKKHYRNWYWCVPQHKLRDLKDLPVGEPMDFKALGITDGLAETGDSKLNSQEPQ